MVTPSFNQARFLEEAIRSVLDQNYANLEYFVIDGGSTDGSVEIIRKYQQRLTGWLSEPDQGQYHAINKGFDRTSGEIMGWLNSDDKHMPWTLHVVGEIFNGFPDVQWLTTLFPTALGEDGHPSNLRSVDGYSRDAFWRGANLPGRGWFAEDFIQQEATFWRRSLWDRCGAKLDLSLKHAADFELWARFFAQGAELHGVLIPLGGFRLHNQQKTALIFEEYCREAEAVLRRSGGRPFSRSETWWLQKTRDIMEHFKRKYWRRLALKDRCPKIYRLRGAWELHRGP